MCTHTHPGSILVLGVVSTHTHTYPRHVRCCTCYHPSPLSPLPWQHPCARCVLGAVHTPTHTDPRQHPRGVRRCTTQGKRRLLPRSCRTERTAQSNPISAVFPVPPADLLLCFCSLTCAPQWICCSLLYLAPPVPSLILHRAAPLPQTAHPQKCSIEGVVGVPKHMPTESTSP